MIRRLGESTRKSVVEGVFMGVGCETEQTWGVRFEPKNGGNPPDRKEFFAEAEKPENGLASVRKTNFEKI